MKLQEQSGVTLLHMVTTQGCRMRSLCQSCCSPGSVHRISCTNHLGWSACEQQSRLCERWQVIKTTAFGGHPLDLVVSMPYLDIVFKVGNLFFGKIMTPVLQVGLRQSKAACPKCMRVCVSVHVVCDTVCDCSISSLKACVHKICPFYRCRT